MRVTLGDLVVGSVILAFCLWLVWMAGVRASRTVADTAVHQHVCDFHASCT